MVITDQKFVIDEKNICLYNDRDSQRRGRNGKGVWPIGQSEGRTKILIIEDDRMLADGLCRALSADDISTERCGQLADARKRLQQDAYSLIILDVNLPDGNGLDYLQEIRKSHGTPVIMLTANDMEMDIVAGLEAGADDYITKPFSLAVLRARVRAQLRKKQDTARPGQGRQFRQDDYIFDLDRMEYFYRGQPVELSKTEQKLLRCLVENQGRTLSRSFLIDHIWTQGAGYVDENALSVSIKRLRDKLSAQEYIRTVYGIGYVWNARRGMENGKG